MKRRVAPALIPLVMIPVMLWPAIGSALDHDNLDPNRPIAIEDAYAIPKGEIGLEGGVRFNDRRTERTRFTFQPQIIYGAFDNTQIEIPGRSFHGTADGDRGQQVRRRAPRCPVQLQYGDDDVAGAGGPR